MATYIIIREDNNVLKLSFGEPAQNDQIVKDAVERLNEMKASGELAGGGIIKLNGPASLPVAIAIAHGLAHVFAAIAAFDPKLNKYVVAISHDPAYKVGDLVD